MVEVNAIHKLQEKGRANKDASSAVSSALPTGASQPVYRRWYDDQKSLLYALSVMEKMPLPMADVLGFNLASVAEAHLAEETRLGQNPSLGTEAVIALHKAQKKQRGYDKPPNLHRMMSTHRQLSKTKQHAMAETSGQLVDCTVAYLKACQAYRQEPKLEIIESLARVFVRLGRLEAEKLLFSLQANFSKLYSEQVHLVDGSSLHSNLQAQSIPAPPPPESPFLKKGPYHLF